MEQIAPLVNVWMKRFKLTAQVAKESDEQAALFDWAHIMAATIPELALLFAVPNGMPLSGPQRFAVINAFKRRGLKPGVPDVFLPVQRSYHGVEYAGLFIELKRKGGILSDEQRWWATRLEGEGYLVALSYGAGDAIAIIGDYLGRTP